MNNNLQALRAYAAYCVVIHHIIDSLCNYIAVGRFNYNLKFGATGVNIFFVVSGFVMMLTTTQRHTSPVTFMRNRIVRIIPIYWLLTCFVIVAVGIGFMLFANPPLTVYHIICSLFFLPEVTAKGGIAFPLLFTGWTLNYEMMFYLVFSLFLIVKSERTRIIGIVAVIAGSWLLPSFFQNVYIQYIGNDVIVAFALGVLLWPLSRPAPPPPSVLIVLAIAGLAGMLAVDLAQTSHLRHVQLFVDAGALLIVYAVISGERLGYSVGPGWLSRQGDISYSLYLIHPFVIQAIGKISLHFGINRSVPGLGVTIVAMALGSAFAALALHHIAERPIIAFFRARTRRDRSSPIVQRSL